MENMNVRSGIFGNRRRVLLIALAVALAALIAGGTLAYFTDQETAYNVITTGKLDMTLHEETTGGKPFPQEGINGVMPGEKVDKKVYVSNDGNVDMYVRIRVETAIVPETLDTSYIKPDINTTDWMEQDGYYYFNRALKPGEKTEPLFTCVSFDADMPNQYQDCTVNVTVNAQAVQSRNNTDSPLTAAGWAE